MDWIWRRARLARGGRRSGAQEGQLADLLPPERRAMAGRPQFWERLRSCVHPDLYVAQLAASELDQLEAADVDAALGHFLEVGARDGRRICALFHPEWYAQQLAARGLELPTGVVPFFHWLTVGWQERIVPTPLFDEDYYREQHPGVDSPWAFAHYLKRGCYQPHWKPSPLGRHHPGGGDPDALRRQRPLLLRELLHRADEYDLGSTSWLEEGCRAALTRFDRMSSPWAEAMIAKAADVEPLIRTPPMRRRMISCPPHRAPRIFLVEQVEAARKAAGRTRVDTVVLVPDRKALSDGPAHSYAQALRLADPAASILLVAAARTESDGSSDRTEPDGVATLDLSGFLAGLDDDKALALVLDVVRGLGAARIVVVDSELGWQLLTTYGRQLSTQAVLGAYLFARELEARGDAVGRGVTRFQECFRHLDWVVVDDEKTCTGLVRRYQLPAVAEQRLLVARTGTEAVARSADVSRRRR